MFNPFKKLFHKKKDANEAEIVFEPYLPSPEFEQRPLIEIKDESTLSLISRAAPGLGKLAMNSGASVYRAVIPQAVTLNAASVATSVYASAPAIAQTGPLANPVSVANVAIAVVSMVVGQYYLLQINKRLGAITESVSRIASFQDNQYKAHLMGLLAQVRVVATFRSEIISNEQVRLQKVAQVDAFEKEALELLGQANLSISGIAKEMPRTFKAYESRIALVESQLAYQKALLECLKEISHLRYALNIGKTSKEQCFALYSGYRAQAEQSQSALREWHLECFQRFEIDLETKKRKKEGLSKAVSAIPSLFNKEAKYKKISDDTVLALSRQIAEPSAAGEVSESDPFHEDVELLYREGKVYYVGK